MDANVFTWIGFYEEFATKLLEYKDKRTELIDKIRSIYERAGTALPTLDKDNNITDIDPFTVFGLFNKGLSDENRVKLAESIKKEFNISANMPKAFNGVPVLDNRRAFFYHWRDDRLPHEMDNLWRIFISALNFAESDTEAYRQAFIDAYNTVRTHKGIKWNLTMGLYWIRPQAYISFDSRNREYIKSHIESLPEELAALNDNMLPDAKTYLAMRDSLLNMFAKEKSDYKNFPEFSYSAWKETQHPSADNSDPSLGTFNAEEQVPHYWLYAPGRNADKWDEFYQAGIMGLGWEEVGDLSAFASKEEMADKMREVYGDENRYTNSAYATWQFSHEIRPGDIVFVKRGRLGDILGRGIVKSGYEYDSARSEYNNIIPVEWTHKGEWKVEDEQFPMKTLTDITRYNEVVEKIRALFEEDDMEEDERPVVKYPPYTAENFLQDVYISRESYNSIKAQLMKKKNIILQGAPGVGKTFVAKRLAYSLMGVEDKERVMMVQFHQSYSYEDFIMGLRPTENGGYQLRKGPFYKFCQKAELDGRDHFFIIDEINRGNLNKIFGELFMLLEADKRGEEIQLLYKDEQFSVPKNLYLIGTMNTADRSLAFLDYALRRRFSFFSMKPGFDTDGFRAYQNGINNEKFSRLIAAVVRLNQYIKDDETLGEGFIIGHSYFCNLQPDEVDDTVLSGIVEYELLPLISEYWFDEPSKVADWSVELRGALR